MFDKERRPEDGRRATGIGKGMEGQGRARLRMPGAHKVLETERLIPGRSFTFRTDTR